MSGWKAGPEVPRTRFCWACSRRLHGRVHMRVRTPDGAEHDIHKSCQGRVGSHTLVYESTTAPQGIAGAATTGKGARTSSPTSNTGDARGRPSGSPTRGEGAP